MFDKIFNQIKSLFLDSSRSSNTDLEWEGSESVGDFESSDFFTSGTKLRKSIFLIAYILIGVVFIVIWTRLWSLQVVQGDYNRQLAEENRVRTKTTVAPRGMIYDRNMKVLATSQPGFALLVYPADLSQEDQDKEKIYSELKKLINLKKKKWDDMIEKNLYQLDPIILKENLSQKKALILKEKVADMTGVSVEDQIRRKYDNQSGLGHLLGYIGKITQEEYDSLEYDDLSYADYLGKSGIEKYYDELLRGRKGRKQVEVDSVGRVKRVLAEQEPVVGDSLVLSIDAKLQKRMALSLQEMARRRGSNKGVAIASNPRTGEILGMVSLPSYDNNIFSSPKVAKEYSKLLEDPDQPLFNRNISGLYPTGSVIKPIVAAAALQEKIVSINDWINCKGEILVENQYNPDIVYRFKDWATHGPVNVIKAIAESCNVFFYHVSGGFGRIKGLGYQKLANYFDRFGLGKKSGIDLPLEEKGLIPSPEWKQTVKDEDWFTGDTYHIAIGQGDLLATPIQVNNYIVAIANGGDLLQPYIAEKTIGPKGKKETINKRKVVRKKVVSKKNAKIVRQGMRATVLGGTAKPFQDLPVSSGAKTGTAQTSQGEGKEHSWFTAFAPYNNPKIVVTVMVENGGEGYDSALPVAKNILNYYFSN